MRVVMVLVGREIKSFFDDVKEEIVWVMRVVDSIKTEEPFVRFMVAAVLFFTLAAVLVVLSRI